MDFASRGTGTVLDGACHSVVVPLVFNGPVSKESILKPTQANYSNLISFLHFGWRVWRCANREWKDNWQEINKVVNRSGMMLETSYKDRLRLYAFINQILMNWVTSLRGTAWSRQEQDACSALTTLIPFYDDQFDQGGHDFSWQSLLKQANAVDSCSIIICKVFLRKILDHLPDQDEFFRILDRTHLAQQRSLDQKGMEMNVQDLERITMEKGGNSMLLYRSLWKHPPKPGEREAWYYLGGALQLSNDIFDIYRDLQSGISTLATKSRNVPDLRQLFLDKIQLTARAVQDLDYPSANRRALLRKVMFICGRVLVCLDQLEEVQIQNGGRFEVEKLDRTDLVCDMERPGNFLKGMAYSLIDLDKNVPPIATLSTVPTSELNVTS